MEKIERKTLNEFTGNNYCFKTFIEEGSRQYRKWLFVEVNQAGRDFIKSEVESLCGWTAPCRYKSILKDMTESMIVNFLAGNGATCTYSERFEYSKSFLLIDFKDKTGDFLDVIFIKKE